MNKGLISLLGFIFFLIGMIALILSLIGLKLSFLAWVDDYPLFGLLTKLGLVMIGLIMMYVVRLEHE